MGNPIKDKWVHIAWVWDGGDPLETDSGNIKFYQNGTLKGIFSANILEREKAGVKNRPEVLPEGNNWPFVIGEGLQGFSSSSFVSSTNSYIPSNAIINSTPWLGNVAEMRIWNVSRTASEIANNRRKRLTGSETGLVSYYKFDEGTGKIANDSNSTRSSADANHATIYGIGSVGTS